MKAEESEETLKNTKKQKDCPLFPSANGKKQHYGTNNTLELLEAIPSEIVELKLDEVLTAVKTTDNLCDFAKCKAKTNLMGQNCDFCHKRYCFKHGLPEVHGCGNAVKLDERKKFMHPKPLKTIRQEEELAQARKKLNSKLKDMQVERMKKSGKSGEECNTKKGSSQSKKKRN